MKKTLFLMLPLFILCGKVDAKKPDWADAVWFMMERQAYKEKQPNESVNVNFTISDVCITHEKGDGSYP